MDKTDALPNPQGRPAEDARAAAPATTTIRDLVDELVLVFVLVMFLKTFLVEHYKIPTGSMTPTLLGGQVAYVTFEDGAKGLAYWNNVTEPPLVYVKEDGRYLLDPNRQVDTEALLRAGRIHEENDHVLVNRTAYWFHNPSRGDIVVFKVPAAIWKPEAPIYIKRLVGEPGETLSFSRDGHLVVNGAQVEQPGFFRVQHYLPTIDDSPVANIQRSQMDWHYTDMGAWKIDRIRVPNGQCYVFGDNSVPHGSWDSRYWGGVPIDNFKGKAFVRVWPLGRVSFLH